MVAKINADIGGISKARALANAASELMGMTVAAKKLKAIKLK